MARKPNNKGIDFKRYNLTKKEFLELTTAQQSDIRQAEHRRRWRTKNTTKVNQYHSNWRAKNKDKVAGYHKKYQERNPEKMKEWRAKYQQRRKEQIAAGKAALAELTQSVS